MNFTVQCCCLYTLKLIGMSQLNSYSTLLVLKNKDLFGLNTKFSLFFSLVSLI